MLLSNNDVPVPVDGIIRRCVETRTICSIEGAFLLLMRVDFNWDKSSRAPCQTSPVQHGTSRAPSAADAGPSAPSEAPTEAGLGRGPRGPWGRGYVSKVACVRRVSEGQAGGEISRLIRRRHCIAADANWSRQIPLPFDPATFLTRLTRQRTDSGCGCPCAKKPGEGRLLMHAVEKRHGFYFRSFDNFRIFVRLCVIL